jgi:hypothetical protein
VLLRSLTVSLAASLRGVDRKTSASFASHLGAPLHRTGPLCFRSGQPGLLTPAGRCRVFRLLSFAVGASATRVTGTTISQWSSSSAVADLTAAEESAPFARLTRASRTPVPRARERTTRQGPIRGAATCTRVRVNPGSRATSRASFRQRPRSTIAYVQPRADRTLCAPHRLAISIARVGQARRTLSRAARTPPFSGLALVRDPRCLRTGRAFHGTPNPSTIIYDSLGAESKCVGRSRATRSRDVYRTSHDFEVDGSYRTRGDCHPEVLRRISGSRAPETLWSTSG